MILSRAHFDLKHQSKLIVSLVNSDYTFLFDLQGLEKCTPEWKLIKLLSNNGKAAPHPLCFTICPDQEKIVVGFDDNRLLVLDIHGKCLNQWSKVNNERFPSNFLKRYNRYIDITPVSST